MDIERQNYQSYSNIKCGKIVLTSQYHKYIYVDYSLVD